jgi:hypothetical protein
MNPHLTQVTTIFKTNLSNKNTETTYESILKTEFTESDSQSAWIEIKDLINSELEAFWDKKQSNTNKFFNKSKLNLVIYYGKPEFIGKHVSKQDLTIQMTENGLELIIFYEVGKAEFLTNISNNLNQYSELSLYMRLNKMDEEFTNIGVGKGMNTLIAHLSLTFCNP